MVKTFLGTSGSSLLCPTLQYVRQVNVVETGYLKGGVKRRVIDVLYLQPVLYCAAATINMDSDRCWKKRGIGMWNLKWFYYCFSGMVLMLGASSLAAQTCRNEVEVPSTTPSSRFTDHGNGTATDGKTGLMWMKCPLGQSGSDCATGSANTYTWQEALDVADGYSFAGYNDWRLPNIKELRSIVEQRCYDPAVNLAVFPATSSSSFWSASPSADDLFYAWDVDFNYGGAGYGSRGSNRQVRLVRSGR